MQPTSLTGRLHATAFFAILALGCRNQSDASQRPPLAQFGLFFGGQIQQRTDIPLEFDSTRQTIGFRILFPEPLSRSTDVEWILDYPKARSGRRGRSNAPRAERTERTTLLEGMDRFEQVVQLRSTDLPGTYNIRVLVGSQIVLDRPFRMLSRPIDVDE